MAQLEELRHGSTVKGLAYGGTAKVVQIEWFGDQAAKITYEDNAGRRRRCHGRSRRGGPKILRHGRDRRRPRRARHGRIADEVLQHLTTLPRSKVRVSVEIEAEAPEGVPDDIQRIVNENGQTLGFKTCGLERS